jgi:hypothetical protein
VRAGYRRPHRAASINARIRFTTGASPVENRLADQEMPDIQLRELRNGGDRYDIVEGQAVTGMHLDPVLRRQSGGVGNAAQLGGLRLTLQLAIAPGVQFDDRRAQPDRRFDLRGSGSMNSD